MRNVVIGILGTSLDSGKFQDRWQKWRPSVGICQHEELLVDRFELLHEPRDQALAELVASDIANVSPETTVNRHALKLVDAWDFDDVFARLLEFARGCQFQPEEENYLIHITTGTHVEQICLFLLAESRHIPGQLLQTSPPPRNQIGAGRYRIIDLDLSKYDALATRFAQQQQEARSFLKSGIETRNGRFNALIEQIETVAIASTAPLLITGPTGAGKSQLARKIYQLKRQRQQLRGEMVELNCATLRGDQAMSALFGHIKGAFTGATGPRPGLLKSAHQGLLFLDEIGELGLDEQAMLLRAIEEKRFLPVGSDKEVESDFQLIAGTNRDLKDCVKQRTFREDLLARINLWTFCLPGLKDRREDIEPNLDFELDRFARVAGRKVTMNKEARQGFLAFAESREATWDANFRDLNASITRMATLAASGRITVADVETEIGRLQTDWGVATCDDQQQTLLSVLDSRRLREIDLFDQAQLAAVIEVCRQSRSLSDAGRQLFAVSRLEKRQANDADRLRKYLARFGLTWGDLS
ncbi:RNA repair transcriptional activator RtcR [Planctomicrobium piriforme]|uniref:Transcriptional regulatory protein RtcR n=1 Tax=Planctomicrobium piriforme TaxID=1576369 RepID=A0A1I3Q3H0_9PLAN|nr:RNA repair transcriptional activator RtcR [Planctomicrobium piriforme]SFJ27981.1 transcriptional regulatory protein RtcR [Planctomicrobium piriforme]